MKTLLATLLCVISWFTGRAQSVSIYGPIPADEFFQAYYIVAAEQLADHSVTCEFQPFPPDGPWFPLGGYSCYPIHQWVLFSMPAWTDNQIVRSLNTPCAPAAAPPPLPRELAMWPEDAFQ